MLPVPYCSLGILILTYYTWFFMVIIVPTIYGLFALIIVPAIYGFLHLSDFSICYPLYLVLTLYGSFSAFPYFPPPLVYFSFPPFLYLLSQFLSCFRGLLFSTAAVYNPGQSSSFISCIKIRTLFIDFFLFSIFL